MRSPVSVDTVMYGALSIKVIQAANVSWAVEIPCSRFRVVRGSFIMSEVTT